MSNSYFQFKQFTIHQDRCAMKVTTDGCLFGAWVAHEIANHETVQTNLLDIGTGTGLLSLMIAQKTIANIDAVEIDSAAYEQAKENINASPWKERIRVFNDDIKKINSNQQYDCIVSNPPFYENELQSPGHQKNIAHHSTDLALKDVLQTIKTNLSGTGIFFLMLPYKRNTETDELFNKNGMNVTRKILVSQSVNHDNFRIFIKGELKQRSETTLQKIAIRNGNNEYSPEFIHLMKEYYLHL